MDGLLVDTENAMFSVWRELGKEYGFNISNALLLEVIGSNEEATELTFKRNLGSDFPFKKLKKIRIIKTDEYFKNKGIPLKPGAKEILDFLKESEIVCAVATSTEKSKAREILEQTGITDYFHKIVAGNEVRKSKPEPDIFLKACELINIPPEDCIVLEDSEKGVQAAVKAGIPCIMVPDLVKPTEEIKKTGIKICNSLMEVIIEIKKMIIY